MNDNIKLTTFFDTVGRTIIGEPVNEDDDFLYVKNPAVVNVVPQQDPSNPQSVKMALQLFPLFFKEFLAAPTEGTCWKFRRNNIVETDGELVFDFKLMIQYQQIFIDHPTQQPSAPEVPQAQTNSSPVKLFED